MGNLLMAVVAGLTATFVFSLRPSESTQGDPYLFAAGTACFSCHNQLVAPTREDISIRTNWRASMMANSARDPYWQVVVRREVMDHPESAAEIEDECAACHMPMAKFEAKAAGELGQVFAHLSGDGWEGRSDLLAMDGVSCTMCRQITGKGFGEAPSFNCGVRRGYGSTPRKSGSLRSIRSGNGPADANALSLRFSAEGIAVHSGI